MSDDNQRFERKNFANDFLLNLRPYKTVSQEIWSIGREERKKALKLDWNEATIEPAPEVRNAVAELVASEDFFHIYPSTLNSELLDSLSAYAGVPTENIQYFASSDSLHEYIAKLFIGKGDKVLLLWPSYDNFRSTVEGNGAQIVYSEIDLDAGFDYEKLKDDLAKEKPKLVYICNPNNPVGYLIRTEQIRELVQEHQDIMFVIDEAYAEFSGETFNPFALVYENVLVTHTMSKAFALANVRFGYLVASVSNIDLISRIRNPKNIPTVTQVAVLAALRHTDYMWRYVFEVRAAREQFIQSLTCEEMAGYIHVFDSKANFVLVKCRDIATKSRIYYSLRKKNIYIRQLSQSSSLLDCVRITIGTREQMKVVYEELKKILTTEGI